MRKRVDHDATQEVSSSQLVPDARPPVYGNVPKNDASMWLSAPVSADDFVGAANKKKRSASRGRSLVIGATAIALLGVTGAGAYYALLRESPSHTSAFEVTPSATPAAATQTAAPPSGSAEAPAPAQVAAPTVAADAGLATAPADAAVAADVAALEADAVSAADPAIKKPTKKRAATKKKVVKKKQRR